MDFSQHMAQTNEKKTKNIIFNFTKNYPFSTRLKLNDEVIETVTSTKLLGTIISNDLSWDLNIQNIVKKANSRMELLRRVVNFGVSVEDLKTIYFLFIRSHLEQSATVWHSSLTQENCSDLERVQKSAVKLILGTKYNGYEKSLRKLGMEKLSERREQLCLNFARKCVKNPKTKHMFPENIKKHNMQTRSGEKFKVYYANNERFKKSSIIYMQNLLNQEENK